MLLASSFVAMLSGCAGSVIFGHVVGQDHQTTAAAPAAAPAGPPAAAPAAPMQAGVPPPPAATLPPVPAAPPVPSDAPPSSGPQAPLVASSPAAMAPPPGVGATHRQAEKFSSATVIITPDAAGKVAADPRFSRDELLTAVTAALQAHQMLDDGAPDRTGRTLQVVVNDLVVQPVSNAVVLGYVVSDVTLAGSLIVRDPDGRQNQRFEIKAGRRLTARVDDKQPKPLTPLYRKFSDLAISRLTGVPIREPKREMPR
jgi:hypothetical protein